MHPALPVLAVLPAGLLAYLLQRRSSISPSQEMSSPSPQQQEKEPSYSLWLAPASSHPSHAVFSTLIASLPGPRFPAHATLLGAAPAGASLAHVVQGIERALVDWRKDEKGRDGELQVELEDVRKGKEFFRCVLTKLKDDPSLHALHDHILVHLPSPTERPTYFPHVSLLYSNIPQEERQAVVDELYASGRARAVQDGAELRGHAGDAQGIRAVRFGSVVVVQTRDVAPEDWKPVAEVKL